MNFIIQTIDPMQKRREETQRALDRANAALYSSRRITAESHTPGCFCKICDWVADYEYEQSILFPESVPNYCHE